MDDNYQGKKNNLFVNFQIVEGPQTLVKSLNIEGYHALSPDTLLNVVGSSPGQPYSAASVSSDRNNILAMYYNEGFPEARLDDTVSPAALPNEVSSATKSPKANALTSPKFCSPAINTLAPASSRARW